MNENLPPSPEFPEADPIPQEMLDMELVDFLLTHIKNPCSTEVEPGRRENIRYFYISEAKRILPTLTNPHAQELLRLKIAEYESNPNL